MSFVLNSISECSMFNFNVGKKKKETYNQIIVKSKIFAYQKLDNYREINNLTNVAFNDNYFNM